MLCWAISDRPHYITRLRPILTARPDSQIVSFLTFIWVPDQKKKNFYLGAHIEKGLTAVTSPTELAPCVCLLITTAAFTGRKEDTEKWKATSTSLSERGPESTLSPPIPLLARSPFSSIHSFFLLLSHLSSFFFPLISISGSEFRGFSLHSI